MEQKRAFLGLLRPRQCLIPTWRGWGVLLGALGLLTLVAVRETYPFLAVSQPLSGGVLAVEGWAPDVVIKMACAEFNRGHYERLYVTGGPIDQGGFLSEYGNFAELGAASVLKLGLSTNVVQPVPAPFVPQDRTYTAAVALKNWMRQRGISPSQLNLITVGPHARRSRLLYSKAFGKGVSIRVLAVPEGAFDPNHWWLTSAGVRTVLSEVFAYGYVRVFFWAKSQT